MNAIDEIKKLYYAATRATIQKDVERAIELLKTLPDEEARQRVAVYMDGLSQMRSEWFRSAPPSSGPRSSGARGHSGRSSGSGRRDR